LIVDQQQRLDEAADKAKEAEEQGDDRLANEEWRRFRLAMRDPEELLAEGIALSVQALSAEANRADART
jgi:hypothetical protein